MDFNLAFPEQLSQHLRSLRKARRLSQVQLAAKMGVAQSRIAAIEKDATKLTAEQLFRVLAALNARVVLRAEDLGSAHDAGALRSPPAGGQW